VVRITIVIYRTVLWFHTKNSYMLFCIILHFDICCGRRVLLFRCR